MITLAFADKKLEEEYSWHYARRARRAWRSEWIMVAAMWWAFLAWDYVVLRSHWHDLLWMRIAVTPVYLAALLVGTLPLRSFRRYVDVTYFIVGFAPSLAVIIILAVIKEPMAPYAYVAISLISIIPHVTGTPHFIVAITGSILAAIGHTIVMVILRQPTTLIVNASAWLATATVLGGFASYNLELFARHVFAQRRALKTANARIESLVHNMLPPSIADRLQADASTIADHHGSVSVLFADIVGFTPLSQTLPPERVVEVLNTIFTAFDATCTRLGLEKIKTIGDAYMVAAGLPTAREDHAEVMVQMAIEMNLAIAQISRTLGMPLNLRIGIHSGPVVAGVIGKQKYSYDLWGDTVNTASRMESHGIAGAIQISETTFHCLGPSARLFTARGPIEVKGKGIMNVYVTAMPAPDPQAL